MLSHNSLVAIVANPVDATCFWIGNSLRGARRTHSVSTELAAVFFCVFWKTETEFGIASDTACVSGVFGFDCVLGAHIVDIMNLIFR